MPSSTSSLPPADKCDRVAGALVFDPTKCVSCGGDGAEGGDGGGDGGDEASSANRQLVLPQIVLVQMLLQRVSGPHVPLPREGGRVGASVSKACCRPAITQGGPSYA